MGICDEVDLTNRDPNDLNNHLKIQFEDILAEPEGIQSIDCVWKLSHTCFTCWLNICYQIATLFYGICIAAEWGFAFAFVAFWHIWYITPILRMLQVNCTVLRKLMQSCTTCCLEPCCEACGLKK